MHLNIYIRQNVSIKLRNTEFLILKDTIFFNGGSSVKITKDHGLFVLNIGGEEFPIYFFNDVWPTFQPTRLPFPLTLLK